MNFLDLRDLRVAFGDAPDCILAVDGASFSIGEGEAYGLVGELGCGKSTILRAISGLNASWTGEIILEGARLEAHRSLEQHRRVQMVFQDPYGSLHPRQTIDSILGEPIAIHGLDDANGRINRALEQVGLGRAFRFRYPHQLSGGQRQRVAIARAMILEPRLLLLDEPTSALDVSIQQQVLVVMDEMVKRRGMGLILISHNLHLVSSFCDRVLVMYAGQIVEVCDTGQLHEAQHPYTTGLLAALPKLGHRRAALPQLRRDPEWLIDLPAAVGPAS